jgi:D-3-phosphoglycerate dehydrogenase
MKVFISTSTFAEYDKAPLDLLRKKGMTVHLNPHKRKLAEKEIFGFLKRGKYDGLLAGTESLTKQVLKNASGLKVISRVGVGLDNIDLAAAKQLKIKVFNTPDVLTDSVAELTLGLILSCLRKIGLMDRKMREKAWSKEMGLLLRDKRLGIIGFGKIGRRVARLAEAFGAKVIFYDTKPVKAGIGRKTALNTLLKDSDIISIHAATKVALITGKEIKQMKTGVILINTSRGLAIDEPSLIRALKSGKVAFAGLDVFASEPYYGGLVKLNNVVITPHVGSYAKETRVKMELAAVDNLLKGLK